MPDRYVVDEMGYFTLEADTTGMRFPYKCLRCGCVHDVGIVTVTARYQDCSVWECPGCHTQIDDRPRGWGGSAERVDRAGLETSRGER